MTATDRPPVTDNARAVREAAMNLYRAMRRANPDAWAEVDEVEDWAYWDDIVRTAQVTLAAGRAETTTEDVWDHGYRAGLRDASRGTPGESPNPYRAETTTAAADQALAEAWAEGHRTGWEHCQDGNYGNDYWDDPTPNPYAADRPSVTDNARAEAFRRFPDGIDVETGEPVDDYGYPATAREAFIGGAEWAAARAETTTEEWPRCKASRDGGCDRCHDEHGRHIHCRAETTTATTATTEDVVQEVARLIDSCIPDRKDAYGFRHAMKAAVAMSERGLLATARSHPTRDDISDATEDAARVLDDVIQHLRKIWSTGHDEAREVIDAAEELLSQALPRLLATARAETTAATTIRYDTFDDGTVELHEVVASNATPNRKWAR